MIKTSKFEFNAFDASDNVLALFNKTEHTSVLVYVNERGRKQASIRARKGRAEGWRVVIWNATGTGSNQLDDLCVTNGVVIGTWYDTDDK